MKRTSAKIVFLVVFWLLCAMFVVLYDNALLLYTDAPRSPAQSFWSDLGVALLVTLVGATACASFDVLVLSRAFRRQPLGRTLLAKTSFWLFCIFVFNSLAQLLILDSQSEGSVLSPGVLQAYLAYASSPYVIMAMVYWGVAVLFGLFFIQTADKFGQGVLLSFLLGKYHRPKEENRIFMFIDLKSSTRYAEELGHVAYSRLIQDCFYDLTDVVMDHRALIYQYVGDEVVLTWDTPTGVAAANCVRSFFAFDQAIQARRDHYLDRYGMLPEFKAGLHVGTVTAAEVGEIKRELAYHGDVLNTASRIQGKCNELGSRILVSEPLMRMLGVQEDFAFVPAGSVALRGRREPVTVYDTRLRAA